MDDEGRDTTASEGIEASEQKSPGAEINELLSYAIVDLEFGLNVLQRENQMSIEERRAAQDGLRSACSNILSVAEIIRSENRFWTVGGGDEEVSTEEVQSGAQAKEEGEASLQGAEDQSANDDIGEPLEVLLLDDEFRMGRVFQRILGDRSELVMATTVSEAWRLLGLQAFDVIFCDVHLPGVSGAEFFRELQKRDPEQSERVIFITGGLYSEESQQLIEEVENPVVYKPFDVEEIESAMRLVLE